MFSLRLTLLGGFEASLSSGRLLSVPARKTQALLSYLALRPGLAHGREKLAALLWGDTPDDRARHSLRQALVSLRAQLPAEPPALIEQGASITANGAAIDVDVLEFERLTRTGTRAAMERAVPLYRGDLLDGLNVGAQTFDDWLVGERERLRELAVETLSRLLTAQIKDEAIDAAIETGVRLLTLDPAHEAAHRALMRLYVRQGRRAAALRQYQTCVGVLERELGGEPEAATKALYQEIIRVGAPATPPVGARADVQGSPTGIDVPGGETPLVGRDADLASLHERLEAARSGRGGVAIVLGEAGIGKSRLVAALAASVRDDERVMIGRAYETERILPFGPWLSAFRAETVLQGDVVRDLEPVWRGELARLFPELGKRDPAPLPNPQDPARLFEACAQLITRLAARETIVLVLEDLHWADEMTLRLLAFLARRVHAARALIVLTARDEDLADAPVLAQLVEELRTEQRLLAIPLAPLTRDETRQLVRALARSGSRQEDMDSVDEHVWQFSKGHPFTAVELMRALAVARTSEPADLAQVPERVRDVIAARLSRLGPDARELVAVAASIGRASGFRLLQRAAGLGEREAAGAIEELVRRRVFQGVGKEFDFVHDRVRTVAYGRLLEPKRRTLHGAVVAALEEVHAERLDDVWDALAYHAERAEDARRAVSFLTHASDKALRTYAIADAIAALERAIALVPELPAAARDRWLVDLTIRLGFALSLRGRHREIPALFAPHAERLDALGDPHLASAYHFRLALTVSMLGDQKAAAGHAERAVEHAARADDRGAVGRGRYALGLAIYIDGDLRAGADHARQAIRDLEDAGDRLYLGYAYWVAALTAYQLGELAQAREAARQIDVIGAEIGDDKLRNFAAWTFGWIEASTGHPDAAIEACQRGIDLARDLYGRAQAVGVLGYAYVEKGDAPTAIAALEEALKILRDLRVRQMEGRYSAFFSEALLLAGDRPRARDAAMQSLQLTVETSHAYGIALARRALGRVDAADDKLTEATGHLREAREIFASLGARFEEGRTELALAEVLTAFGQTAPAAESLARARAAFVRCGAPRYVERVDRLNLGAPTWPPDPQ